MHSHIAKTKLFKLCDTDVCVLCLCANSASITLEVRNDKLIRISPSAMTSTPIPVIFADIVRGESILPCRESLIL